MKITALILLTIAFALPLHAGKADGAAKSKKPAPKAVFKKKDKDHDGFLSKDEFIAKSKNSKQAEAAFAKKDKDGDGKLSIDEFSRKPAAKKGKGAKNKKQKN